ncbi:MAG TPA: hypothetical protein VMJ72_02940 [Candidatus Paceibacterota bacterium]|nr:hypothetical protein [Candidatus Paceibacterota bacterium]
MKLLTRLWNTNPLSVIGAAVAVQVIAVQAGYWPVSLLLTMILVMELGYLQNTAYGLQSRSANRNSNAYHLIAAVASNFTFFWSLRLLKHNDITLVLLAPYMFATILGTLHGNSTSIRIEKALHISMGDPKGQPQLMRLWPTILALFIVVSVQVWRFPSDALRWHLPFVGAVANPLLKSWLGQTGTIVSFIVAISLLDSFTQSFLRLARSTDSYAFHAFAVVVQLTASLAKMAILLNLNVDWSLFFPTTTGSVMGSILGANFGRRVATHIGAMFDAHVCATKDEEKAWQASQRAKEAANLIPWPTQQIAILSGGLIIQLALVVWGLAGLTSSLALVFFSAWQSLSFTMKSRAGQRDHQQYLAWTSVFSNGVWYLTLNQLARGSVRWEKAMPFIVGGAIGSLVGQLLSMRAERMLGAVMDEKPGLAAKV